MEKVLVTGGAGFIGSHVCDMLLQLNKQVVCLDCFNDYYDPEVKLKNISHNLKNTLFKLYKDDFTNQKAMQKMFDKEKFTSVIHLGARAGVRPSLADPMLYEEVNIKGTMILLEQCRKHNIKNFVFASSSSVYGGNKKVPFSEKDMTDTPISPYAATKKAGEAICHTYHHLYGMRISCLRFFTVYGPRGRPDMAPYIFTKKILAGEPIDVFGDGTAKRDFTYVEDIVSGIIAAWQREYPFEIFNLGNSNTIRVSEFIKIIEDITGKKAIINYKDKQAGDVDITFSDISKAKKMLDFSPKTNIRQGMAKFIYWYQNKDIK